MNLICSGKVRDIYDLGNGNIVINSTDRISVFDAIVPTTIPDKGIVLNRMSEFGFNLTQDIIKNHMISIKPYEMPHEFQSREFKFRCMLAKKLNMIPIECVVRGHIAGRAWKEYTQTGSICGIELPIGLMENEKLPYPIYTPRLKVKHGHDILISFEDVVHMLGENLATQLKSLSIRLYIKCAEYAESRGLILADTKFEFGLDEFGNLYLADEIFTPDSSRIWYAKSFKLGQHLPSSDKQYLRDYLASKNWNGRSHVNISNDVISMTRNLFIEVYETLTGNKFTVYFFPEDS